jgi:ATP-dependent RNA helicase DDX47/RRP3
MVSSLRANVWALWGSSKAVVVTYWSLQTSPAGASSVPCRSLDIPCVDIVDFDVTNHSKDYIHRVGRTAQAGRAGKTILIVTQYDVEFTKRLEDTLRWQLELWPTDKEEVLLLRERVGEAARLTVNELKEQGKQRRKRHANHRNDDDRDRDDDAVETEIPVTKHRRNERL